jgi:hypothetical protein
MRRLTPVLLGGLLAAMPATATAAPERVFELITPAAKGGSDISSGYFATPDGDAVAFESFASLGNPSHALFSSAYVARRESDGWKTTSMQATVADPNPLLTDSMITAGFSADLTTAFMAGWNPFEPGDENMGKDISRVRDGVSEWVTPALSLPDDNLFVDSDVVGTSADGRHFVTTSTKQILADVPGGTPQIYLHGPDGVELASYLPDGSVATGARLGNGRGIQGDDRAISADGRTLFFTTTPGVAQLYVRKDGVTKLISADVNGNPGTAASVYRAATEDGSRVLFSSTSQLTAGAPVGGGLYRYDVETDELRLMVAGTITGVMQTSDDLSVAYVVSSAQLDPGQGSPNMPKLFRVTDDGAHYISAIAGQDSYGWMRGQGANIGGVTPDGSRLVFQTRTPLAGANIASPKVGVYRYDAPTDTLKCISCPPDGSAVVAGATLTSGSTGTSLDGADNASRAITADGRLAVFQSPDPLLPEDENDLTDVYGYDDDGLHLISGGQPDGESQVLDVTPDGGNVFFISTAKLAAEDTDQGYRDVYTARIGGGFPPVETPCTAGSCERPDAPPTVFTPVIGSTGVFGEPADPAAPKVGFRVSSLSAASRRSWARTGKTRLRVRLTGGGAKVTATTKLSGRKVSTARASRESAGTATLTLKLSKAARARLERNGRLKLTVTVAVSGVDKASKATVTLTKPKSKSKAKSKKAGR